MPQLTVEGRTLSYQEAGRGAPVVLLHPFPLHSGCFAAQLAALGRARRVLAPDLRGFGGSSPGAGPAGMTEMAGDILALLDALELETAVVGGCSMGGYVAMALLRLDPTRVAGLVLMNTQARADDEAGKAAREATAQRIMTQGVETLVETLAPRLVSPEAPAPVRDRVAAMIREGSPEGAAAATRGMAARMDSREILSRYAGPALVISGERDALIPEDRSHELAALISGSRHVRIAGAGHLAPLEAPEPVNAALLAFP